MEIVLVCTAVLSLPLPLKRPLAGDSCGAASAAAVRAHCELLLPSSGAPLSPDMQHVSEFAFVL